MTDISVNAAHGSLVKLRTSTGPDVFTTIQGVHNGPKGPGFEPQMIEATFHDKTTMVQKASRVRIGAVTFDMYYDSLDTAVHGRLLASAMAATKETFSITLTDGGAEVYTFEAIPGMTLSADNENFVLYSVTLNIIGAVTAA